MTKASTVGRTKLHPVAPALAGGDLPAAPEVSVEAAGEDGVEGGKRVVGGGKRVQRGRQVRDNVGAARVGLLLAVGARVHLQPARLLHQGRVSASGSQEGYEDRTGERHFQKSWARCGSSHQQKELRFKKGLGTLGDMTNYGVALIDPPGSQMRRLFFWQLISKDCSAASSCPHLSSSTMVQVTLFYEPEGPRAYLPLVFLGVYAVVFAFCVTLFCQRYATFFFFSFFSFVLAENAKTAKLEFSVFFFLGWTGSQSSLARPRWSSRRSR